MKAVVSTGKAYFCTILSSFAVVILSFIGYLFNIGHESMMGSTEDPEDGKAVAKTVFGAVFVYLAFLVFCGLQVVLIQRQNRIQLS
ncbi:V-type proton ATPase subunit f [[Candida] anglica]|uniref:V-type proton ATPase subunit f n=1 Tax=[Candida] anglica TaxID=148631 RepID=A0ABP0EBI7_9ASCO